MAIHSFVQQKFTQLYFELGTLIGTQDIAVNRKTKLTVLVVACSLLGGGGQ